MHISPLKSLITCGTKLWLDSVDPELVVRNREIGATGATSNPIIIADLIKSGRFSHAVSKARQTLPSVEDQAWYLADYLVQEAERVFSAVWQETQGNDGYVSFELDPLLEDPGANIAHAERVKRYVDLGLKWSKGHPNRMIKVPATPAGLEALTDLAANGVPLNVTLIFTMRQYEEARNRIWQGFQRGGKGRLNKSVYSIFVSRLDVYADQYLGNLAPVAQGWLGILNAKRIWQANQEFWSSKHLPLAQEIVFASTGTKKPSDAAWKYVEAFAGSDIETNPPATNEAVEASGRKFTRMIDQMPDPQVVAAIDAAVDWQHLEETLMREGVDKFVAPQQALIKLLSSSSST